MFSWRKVEDNYYNRMDQHDDNLRKYAGKFQTLFFPQIWPFNISHILVSMEIPKCLENTIYSDFETLASLLHKHPHIIVIFSQQRIQSCLLLSIVLAKAAHGLKSNPKGQVPSKSRGSRSGSHASHTILLATAQRNHGYSKPFVFRSCSSLWEPI